MDNKLYDNRISEEVKEAESKRAPNKVNIYAEEKPKSDEEELIIIDEDSLYFDAEKDAIVRNQEPLYGERKKKVKEQPAKTQKVKPKSLSEKIVYYGKVVAFFLIPIAIISLISIIILRNTDYGQYKLGYVSKGSICEVGQGSGYFIKKTEAVLSPSDGIFITYLDEGDSVNAGDVIGYITTTENKNVVSKLKQTSASILTLLKLETDSLNSEEKAELEAAQNEIDERLLELVSKTKGGSLEEVSDIKEEIDILLEEKNNLILEHETENETINSLIRQKNELLLTIEEEMVPVVATRSGIISYNFSSGDELENDYYNALSGGEGVDTLSEAAKLQKKSYVNCISSEVKEGGQVARLIVEDSFYIILKLEEGELVKNQTLSLSSKDQSFNTTGYVISTSLDEGYAIILADRGISDCLSKRSETLSYDLEKSSGYCVQLSAITKINEENKTGQIAILINNRVRFVTVEIDCSEENKAIVSQGVDENGYTFKTGDTYIVNPKKVRNGQRISS